MATEILHVTFDGITSVPGLPGQSDRIWFGTPPALTHMSEYWVYHNQAGDDFLATAKLTGSNWFIKSFMIAGEDHHTTIKDADNGAGRVIDYMQLGRNSTVHLISTQVNFIDGWKGEKHAVWLGAAFTETVRLQADLNIVVTGNGDVGTIETSGKSIIDIGDVRAGQVRTGDGNDSITTGAVFAPDIRTGEGNDTVDLGTGGGADILLGTAARTGSMAMRVLISYGAVTARIGLRAGPDMTP